MHRYTIREHGRAVIHRDCVCPDWSVPEGFLGYVIDRLAAYEDTGLTPEDVVRLKTLAGGNIHENAWLRAELEDAISYQRQNECKFVRQKERADELEAELKRIQSEFGEFDPVETVRAIRKEDAELLKKVECVTAERDAAMSDLKESESKYGHCDSCKWNELITTSKGEMRGRCSHPVRGKLCGRSVAENKWEWRGPSEPTKEE